MSDKELLALIVVGVLLFSWLLLNLPHIEIKCICTPLDEEPQEK